MDHLQYGIRITLHLQNLATRPCFTVLHKVHMTQRNSSDLFSVWLLHFLRRTNSRCSFFSSIFAFLSASFEHPPSLCIIMLNNAFFRPCLSSVFPFLLSSWAQILSVLVSPLASPSSLQLGTSASSQRRIIFRKSFPPASSRTLKVLF